MINSKTLFDNFECNGFWWLPENSENRISGRVSFDSEKAIKLELLGAFHKITLFGTSEIYRPDIILGLTEDGKPCTLLKTIQIKEKSVFFEIITTAFEAEYLFLGFHFKNEESILFSSILVNYTYLEEWMNISPIQTETELINDKISKINAVYSCPPKFEIDVPSIEAKICSDSILNQKNDSYRSITWNYTAFIKIIPNKIRSFDWFRDVIHTFQELLTLFIGEPVYQRDIKAIVDNEESSEGRKKNRELYIQFFFSQNQRIVKNKVKSEDMIINLSFIKRHLPKIFENWFKKSNDLKSVCDLFFGTFFNKKTYIEFHFLGLMQAIEAYHRSMEDGRYIEEKKYQEYLNTMISSIPEEIPTDLKNSLKSRLKYGNEHSLRKRLQNTLKNLNEETVKTIFPEDKDFFNQIIDTRNYLTHYSKELKENTLEVRDLFYGNQRLTALITLLLLKQIGIPEQDIIKSIIKSRKFNWLLSSKQ